jgi:hypothetical protein
LVRLSFFGATVELGDGNFQQRTARGGRDVQRLLLHRPEETVTLWVRRWERGGITLW